VLTDCREEMCIEIKNPALLDEHLGDYAVYFMRVLRDCMEENPHLHLIL